MTAYTAFSRRHRSARLLITLAIASLAAAGIVSTASVAYAHDALVDSSPAASTEVQTLPEEITLTFSAPLLSVDSGTAVEVTAPDGTAVNEGAPVVDGAVVTQSLRTEGAVAGEYTVIARVVSSDGHPTDEQLTFTVLTDSAPAPADPAETATPTDEETPATEATAVPISEDSETSPLAEGNADPGLLPWIVIGIAVALIIAGTIIIARKRARLRS